MLPLLGTRFAASTWGNCDQCPYASVIISWIWTGVGLSVGYEKWLVSAFIIAGLNIGWDNLGRIGLWAHMTGGNFDRLQKPLSLPLGLCRETVEGPNVTWIWGCAWAPDHSGLVLEGYRFDSGEHSNIKANLRSYPHSEIMFGERLG